MKKIGIRIFRIITLVFILLLTPVAADRVNDVYFRAWINPKVVALTHTRGRYCSASHIKHKDKVYLVTNRHCCEAGRGMLTIIKKELMTDFREVHKVLKVSSEHDVCIAESNRKFGLQISTDYQIGDKVKLIGYPRGLNLTTREGHIYDIEFSHYPWIPTSNAVKTLAVTTTSYGGNSGSPVVDRGGRVIGLLFATFNMFKTEGFVVPSEFIISTIESINKK